MLVDNHRQVVRSGSRIERAGAHQLDGEPLQVIDEQLHQVQHLVALRANARRQSSLGRALWIVHRARRCRSARRNRISTAKFVFVGLASIFSERSAVRAAIGSNAAESALPDRRRYQEPIQIRHKSGSPSKWGDGSDSCRRPEQHLEPLV